MYIFTIHKYTECFFGICSFIDGEYKQHCYLLKQTVDFGVGTWLFNKRNQTFKTYPDVSHSTAGYSSSLKNANMIMILEDSRWLTIVT